MSTGKRTARPLPHGNNTENEPPLHAHLPCPKLLSCDTFDTFQRKSFERARTAQGPLRHVRDAPPWVDCRGQQVARAAEEQDPKPFAHPGNPSKVRGVTPICPPKKQLLIEYLFGTVTGVCKGGEEQELLALPLTAIDRRQGDSPSGCSCLKVERTDIFKKVVCRRRSCAEACGRGQGSAQSQADATVWLFR